MNSTTILEGFAGLSINTLRLMLRSPGDARLLLSRCLRAYDDIAGHGLEARDVVRFIVEQGWATPSGAARIELPALLSGGGGTDLNEWVYLAVAAKMLKPGKVLEIGTFTGRTTSAFILNSDPGATIVSLDLPPSVTLNDDSRAKYLITDLDLVASREVGSFLRLVGLDSRFEQIFCDSMRFDPEPHRDSVELGFIDGAHALEYVRNDTEKMAIMMAERGLVFWHDYGGKGSFRPLAQYLESLADRIAIYRIAGTSLAWSSASELRKLR
jgi:hypothetical protein